MQVTKGTWRMREQCVPGSLSSSPLESLGTRLVQYTLKFLTHFTAGGGGGGGGGGGINFRGGPFTPK